ncbi:MAG: M20/M25/M40 family metallo-hydrolase, partial [Kofleriaceae bacterium]|nr:M20/M25/M40 family metallo-hydrolase [Kofleriaceae bacterium]
PGVTLLHRASVAERDAARTFLIGELAALGITAEKWDYTSGTRSGANVIATLPGSDPGPAILVGAHFDSVPAGPGAADNATGTALVLATARHLKDVPDRKHTVIFAFFDQEELGLVGSKAYAQSLDAAGTQLRAAHIFDMLSWDSDHDRAVELWSPSPAIEALYRAHGATLSMPIQPVTFASSDHQAFLDAGFAAVGVGEEFVANDHTPHYHKASDTVANVQFDYLEGVTRLAFAVIEADVTAP